MVQFFPLLCCDLSVFAFSDPVQSQIHDPDPFQLLYLISQIPAHSTDLPVQSLCQNRSESCILLSAPLCMVWSLYQEQGLPCSSFGQIPCPPAYSLSQNILSHDRFPARMILLTRSPSFVRRRRPCDSLSSLPTG